MYDTINTVLSAAVAQTGTFTVPYPANRDSGSYAGGYNHFLFANQTLYSSLNGDFSLAFTTVITATWNKTVTLPAGAAVSLQVDRVGAVYPTTYVDGAVNVSLGSLVKMSLGAPITADADGVCASQSISTAGVINGALATGGVATFDAPRNVVAAWTTTAVLTVTGKDVYGKTLVESSGSGTSFAGKKAFKTVTGVAVSTAVTSATVGTGDVLGLPVFLPQAGLVIGEIDAGAIATAGTIVAGVTTTPSATTGDVRGTYDPNSACNGTKSFSLIAFLEDPSYLGRAQYAG